jgi:hypothetical protein
VRLRLRLPAAFALGFHLPLSEALLGALYDFAIGDVAFAAERYFEATPIA